MFNTKKKNLFRLFRKSCFKNINTKSIYKRNFGKKIKAKMYLGMAPCLMQYFIRNCEHASERIVA